MNKYQTPLTEELLSSLPEEVVEQLYDCIDNIQFIKNLISPNRPYYKDLPRDERGAAIVDITNPPIMEDADYFRQPALHFLKHGCYTFLRPNSNPNSEYRKFWEEERRRCYEGLIRPSDGAWISGYNYWFLNYQPMMVNKKVGNSNKAIRVEEFPFFNEGNAWRYYYLYDAREQGHHAIELAKRGCAKSFSLSAIMGHNLILGESKEANRRNITVLTAYQKEYLSDSKDGTLSKFKPAINFAFSNTPFPRLLLKNSPNEMTWQMGYKDEFGREKGSLNQVLAVSSKDDSEKLRGKRGTILFEEMGCHIKGTEVLMFDHTFKKVEDIRDGDSLMGIDGTPRIVSNTHSGVDQMYKITLSNGDWHIVNSKHLVHFKRHLWYKDIDEYLNIPAEELYKWNDLQGCYIQKANIKYQKQEVKIDPYLLGLWLGDGDSNYVSIANEDIEVLDWLSDNYNGHLLDLKQSETCKVFYVPTRENIYNDFRYYKLFGNKHIPEEYIYNSEDVVTKVLAGLIDTDGNLSIKKHSSCFEITQRWDRKHILDAAKAMATNLGLRCTMSSRISTGKKPGVLHYRLRISGDISIIPTKIKRKQAPKLKNKYRSRRSWVDYTFKIEPYQKDTYYGFEVDKDNLFILKDGTVTHNSFKGLLSLYDITRKSVEDGDLVFAFMYLVGCVCAGTKVWTLDGRNINIEELTKEDGIVGFTDSFTTETTPNITLTRGYTKEPIIGDIFVKNKDCVRIVLNNKNTLECSIDHPILIQKLKSNHDGSTKYYKEVFKLAKDLKPGDRVIECREIPIFGNDTLFDARFVGMLIGDGSYGLKNSPKFSSEDKELLTYVKSRYSWGLSATHITKKGNHYEDIRITGICKKLREIGIYGQTKTSKRLPDKYQTLNKENTALLLSGLYDTDGSIWLSKDGFIGLTQCNKEILEQVKILWRKFGVIGSITKTNPRLEKGRKDRNPWYTLVISGRYNCLRACEVLNLLVKHKKHALENIKNYYINNPSKKEQLYPKDIIVSKVLSVENIGSKPVYNLTAGLSHTYLANNIITHNTAAEDESDFSSAKTLLYNTKSYNLHTLENVYDKPNQGKSTFGFFFPSYVNRAGCYNKDGVSDVIKALIQILLARHKAKYSSDPKTVLRVIAEDPITPAEAIIKVKSAYFPVTALNERLTQLDMNPEIFNDVYTGDLTIDSNGEVKFKPTSVPPIRKYGVDNDTVGTIEIFQMPEKNRENKVYANRYIVGHDPVDNDQAESSSLSSTFVLDLFTDNIVAEYTGRHQFAEDNYEIVRLLCLFYNARCLYESNKKGIYAYFSRLNCTHLLADTPEYLRDKQLVKYSSFGSNSKGVNASASINNYANDLIRNWLLKPVPIIINEGGEEKESTMPNLYRLKNRALIEELIYFTPELNVDRIRALGMAMLYREEKMILYQGNPSADREEQADASYLGNDPFFTINYRQQ